MIETHNLFHAIHDKILSLAADLDEERAIELLVGAFKDDEYDFAGPESIVEVSTVVQQLRETTRGYRTRTSTLSYEAQHRLQCGEVCRIPRTSSELIRAVFS